jgi:acetylornithine deacetylase/succinyl-diaminopimelate desuccinylase-like protein
MAFSEKPLNQSLVTPVEEFIAREFDEAVNLLSEFVAIPGIAWPAFDPQNLEISAQRVAQEFEKLEFFDWVEIRKSKKPDGELGSPAILARRAGKLGAPHVMLYAHHDVQPPGDSGLWETEPFVATRKGDRLFGRGASDDKAGIITHLWAIKGLKELGDQLNIGITLFIEGEEEAGSESFANFLIDNEKDLAADLIIVADSGNWTTEVPALTTSLRGMVSQVVTIKTLDHAVHSGMFGGPLPDAMTAMIRLLDSLTDDKGNVAISGLRSTEVDELPLSEEEFRAAGGILDGVQTLGSKSLVQQNWGEPAVTVIGIDAPSVALSSNTAQPEITAKISLRLSPDEDPGTGLELLRKHLESHAPFGARVSFGHSEQGPGYLAKSGWASRLAHEAFTACWPNPSVNIGIGGSIPFITDFARVFPRAEILVTGVEEPDSRAHSPNESQHLPTLKRAMAAEVLLLLHGNQLLTNELN